MGKSRWGDPLGIDGLFTPIKDLDSVLFPSDWFRGRKNPKKAGDSPAREPRSREQLQAAASKLREEWAERDRLEGRG